MDIAEEGVRTPPKSEQTPPGAPKKPVVPGDVTELRRPDITEIQRAVPPQVKPFDVKPEVESKRDLPPKPETGSPPAENQRAPLPRGLSEKPLEPGTPEGSVSPAVQRVPQKPESRGQSLTGVPAPTASALEPRTIQGKRDASPEPDSRTPETTLPLARPSGQDVPGSETTAFSAIQRGMPGRPLERFEDTAILARPGRGRPPIDQRTKSDPVQRKSASARSEPAPQTGPEKGSAPIEVVFRKPMAIPEARMEEPAVSPVERTIVQRDPAAGGAARTEDASQESGPAPAVDLDALASRIYPYIRRLLLIERERLGRR
jgi:hypothetical protein